MTLLNYPSEAYPMLLFHQVMGQDGNIVQFKIKKHTALKKLMSTYCERAGLALQVAFSSSLILKLFANFFMEVKRTIFQ